MAYTRVNWKDSPDSTTPLSADNLNNMDVAIANLDSTMSQVRSEANSARIHAESANTLATENQGRLDNLDTTIEQLETQVEKCPTATDYLDGLFTEWNTTIFEAPIVAHFYQIGAIIFGHLVFKPRGGGKNGVYEVCRIARNKLPKHNHSFPCAAKRVDEDTITSDGATLQTDGVLKLRLTSTTNNNAYLFDLSFFYCVDY